MDGSFLDTLKVIGGGVVLDELSCEQTELLRDIERNQGKGSITLKVVYTPRKAGQMRVSYQIDVKPPPEVRAESLLFVSGGTLQRDDPRQTSMLFDDDAPRRATENDPPERAASTPDTGGDVVAMTPK